MAYKMGRNEDMFLKFFLSYLKQLCYDIVPNVRITLATTLNEIYLSKTII